MKKLIILTIVVIAAWQGWKHYPDLMKHTPSNEAVIQNTTNETLASIRLTVDGQTLVREELAAGASATLPFRVGHDSGFKLLWAWTSRPGESQWAGGRIVAGPMVGRYLFLIGRDGGVIHRTEPLTPR